MLAELASQEAWSEEEVQAAESAALGAAEAKLALAEARSLPSQRQTRGRARRPSGASARARPRMEVASPRPVVRVLFGEVPSVSARGSAPSVRRWLRSAWRAMPPAYHPIAIDRALKPACDARWALALPRRQPARTDGRTKPRPARPAAAGPASQSCRGAARGQRPGAEQTYTGPQERRRGQQNT